MGDGYAYENMHFQTEITCEDCHGGTTERPKAEVITRENEEAVRELKSYQRQMRPGMKMVLTAKGRKYSNVFYEDEKIYVLDKRSGKVHESKVIKLSPPEAVACFIGPERYPGLRAYSPKR